MVRLGKTFIEAPNYLWNFIDYQMPSASIEVGAKLFKRRLRNEENVCVSVWIK